MRISSGFTVIELLISISIMAIIFAIGIPNLLNARLQAQDASARLHANNVYKVAYAYVAETSGNILIESSDCKASYVAGGYSTDASGIAKCEVKDAGDGTPLVEVTSLTGALFTLP